MRAVEKWVQREDGRYDVTFVAYPPDPRTPPLRETVVMDGPPPMALLTSDSRPYQFALDTEEGP